MRYVIQVFVESPLVITSTRATGNVLDTLEYIPGATLRGALAQASLEHGWDPSEDRFRELFLAEGNRFGDCRKGVATPLSARACADDREGRWHGLIDLLLARGARRTPPMECPACRAKLVLPLPGLAEENNRNVAVKCRTRRVAHVQIDPESGRAQSGQFHTSRVVEAGERLQGSIWTTSTSGPHLEELVGQGLTVWVGRGRTRGQGRVTIRFLRRNIQDLDPSAIESLLIDFQNEAARRWQEYEKTMLLAVALNSSAVLMDKWLMTRSWLEPNDLSPDLAGYTLVASFCRMERLRGWHQASQLPKADVDAVVPGSVYLLTKPVENIEEEAHRIAPALANALEAGIGERTIEGYGEIRLNHPFHYEAGVSEDP